MKVKLLSSLVSLEKSYAAGEEITLSDKEAYRLIITNLAEPKNKKEFEEYKKKIEKEQKEKLENEKLLKAQLEREKLEAELNSLYLKVVEKEAFLAGVTLDEKEKFKLVEELKNRGTHEAKNSK